MTACVGNLDRDPVEAVQKLYRNGTPHTDAQGALRFSYDPGKSFFPIGIYHALSGRHYGRDYDLATLKTAGFNFVHFWEGQKPGQTIAPARAAGLQVMVHEPTLADVRRFASDPAVWGWYLDEEPSGHYRPEEHTAKLAVFAARRDAIRALDPWRPVFSLDKPAMDDDRRANWLRWIEASDLAAQFNYPSLTSGRLRTLDTARGIPRSVALAARASDEKKPVLFVVQAFGGSRRGWAMPTPAQLRAMIYAALVHGATGIVYFAFDSFVTRDDGVVGIAPDPSPDYGPIPGFGNSGALPLTATEDKLRESRALWRAARALNSELHTLAPAILSPTANVDYDVSVSGAAVSSAPVRTLLKERAGRMTLIAVNLDDAPLRARMTFPIPVRNLRRMFDGAPPPAVNGGAFEDEFPPFAARVYSFER